MNRTTLATSYRILTKGRNLLAHLLCLLLILSTPALAQGTCTLSHGETRHIDALCVGFTVASPGPCGEGDSFSFEYLDPQSTCGNILSNYNDPQLTLKKFHLGGTKPADQRNVYDMGVDPATLSPEALDLNIFPSFEISAQLSLVPSLSYSPENLLSRMGRIQYGPPKKWRNHYGEIIVMVGATASVKSPAGPSGLVDHPRDPVPSELQIFYINASGQQVNFYPDPSDMNPAAHANKPSTSNGQVTTWFSEDGTYQLKDVAVPQGTGAFDFELMTSQGLKIAFEPYTFTLDSQKEALARHYRVDRITDRYDNFVEISYRDEQSGYVGDPSIQPYQAKGYKNGTTSAFRALTYVYDTQDRLSRMDLPAYGGQTQSYKFFYLDSGQVVDVPLSDGTTTNRLKLNNLYEQTFASNTAGTKAVLPPLVSSLAGHYEGALRSGRLYLNFDDLDFVPEIGIDFGNTYTTGNSVGQFRSAPYRFQLTENSNTGLMTMNGISRQVFSELQFAEDSVHYRYQMEPSDYPSTSVENAYPDMVGLVKDPSVTVGNGSVSVNVYPRLKEGDVIAWLDGSQNIQSGELKVIGETPVANNGSYEYPLMNLSASPAGKALHFIRKDMRDKIAEIEYPGVDGSSRRRMLFKYAEHSKNHAEIEDVLVVDEPLPTGPSRLLSHTTYAFEQVLVQVAAEDLEEMVPSNLPESEWRNCVREGRNLEEINGVAGVGAGIGLLRRHEVLDILRHKRLRYYEPGANVDNVSVFQEDYRTLETFYGGAWRFALMGRSRVNEVNPTSQEDPNNTCDEVEWGVAQKPFSYTWLINPDGSAQIFDLSADGVGLDPVLAYTNTGVRVFKTYQFDTKFKSSLLASSYAHFLGSSTQPYSPYYQYAPKYQLTVSCSPCTIPDLEQYPAWAGTRQIPTISQVFGMSGTKAYGATVDFFEPLPMYGYTLLTDIDSQDRTRKLALGTLHGSIQQSGVATTRTYFRVSAVQGIKTTLDNNGNCDVSLVDEFFRGQATSSVATSVGSYSYTIPWVYGGQLSTGSCVQYIHQRQKNHRLRPHAQIQLQNLAGFSWDTTKNLVDLDQVNGVSPWVVEASRYSNGGYLGKGSATGWTTTGNTSTLNGVTLAAQMNVQMGDYFYFDHKMYQLTTALSNGSMTVKPALNGTSQAISNLQFYRYYSPDAPPTYPYMGYDVFGNNAFKASYKRTELKFTHAQNKATGDDHGLVPNFFDASAIPFTLSLNDSTADANNDDSGWKYFGRITRQFDTGKLSLYADLGSTSLTEYASWKTGMLSETQYPTSLVAYHWLPVETISYFKPVTFSQDIDDLNLAALSAITPVADLEDVRSSYRYFRKTGSGISHAYNNSNPMSHGRVSLEWTGKGHIHPGQAQWTGTRYSYDDDGRTNLKETATYVAITGGGAGLYGTQEHLITDPATGLVKEAKTLVFDQVAWSNTGDTPETKSVFTGTGVLRGRTVTDYDLLGRKTKVTTYDANNTVFGQIEEVAYNSQTQTTTTIKSPTGSVLSTQLAFANAQGQPTASVRQRGGSPDSNRAYVSYISYDAFGRTLFASSEREETGVTNLAALAEGTANQKGYSHTLYNLRGEAFGSVMYLDNAPAQSSWTVQRQNSGTGNLATLQIQQVPDSEAGGSTAPAHLAIKELRLNTNGLLVGVSDYRKDYNLGVWTQQTESALDTIVGTLASNDRITNATYAFDRMGKVIEAEVGIGTSGLQLREFAFDQRGRLRQETHPEMPGIEVRYGNFDHFDNARSVTHMLGTTAVRSWTSTFDTAGNLLTWSAGTVSNQYAYNYQVNFVSNPPAAFPEFLRAVRHTDTETGGTYLYQQSYDPDNGLLTKRGLYHNQSAFPGYASGIASFNLTSNSAPAVNSTLEASYSYDNQGRVDEQIYPTAIFGVTNPTKLKFTYGAHGLLTSAADQAFASQLTVMKYLDYGVGDQLTNVVFATPSSSPENKLERTYDSLNRLATWKVATGQSFTQSRNYGYDLGGRIHEIHIDKQPNSSVFKGHRYAYDSLSQLADANFTHPSTLSTKTWEYTYDSKGFGNLVTVGVDGISQNIAVNLVNNQLSANTTYSQLGELKEFEDENNTEYNLDYNASGRVKNLTATGMNAAYHYDHAGMRTFTKVEGTQQGLDQAQTLYFYDAGGMVLCEWVSEKENGNWQTPRWDKSYLYLAGKSSLTYEYDALDVSQGGGPVPTGPEITSATILNEPILQWQDLGPGSYDLDLQTSEGQKVVSLKQIEGTSWTQNLLRFGKFQARVRRSEQAWGPWKTFYYMDPTSQEQVGIYDLDWQHRDSSYYKKSLASGGDTHFMDGINGTGVFLNQGETLTLTTPHEFLTGSSGSVSFWAKPSVDSSSEDTSYRDLWSLGSMKVQMNPSGQLKLDWPGVTSFQPNVMLSGSAWQHLVVIYGSGTVQVYLDNTQVFNLSSAPTSAITSSDMTWGNALSSQGVETGVDEIRCFDKALTATEITNEYTRWD